MGELEARSGNYKFVIWNYADHTELRFYRYDSVGVGIGVPFYDFSVQVRSERRAKRLANLLNRQFAKA